MCVRVHLLDTELATLIRVAQTPSVEHNRIAKSVFVKQVLRYRIEAIRSGLRIAPNLQYSAIMFRGNCIFMGSGGSSKDQDLPLDRLKRWTVSSWICYNLFTVSEIFLYCRKKEKLKCGRCSNTLLQVVCDGIYKIQFSRNMLARYCTLLERHRSTQI